LHPPRDRAGLRARLRGQLRLTAPGHLVAGRHARTGAWGARPDRAGAATARGAPPDGLEPGRAGIHGPTRTARPAGPELRPPNTRQPWSLAVTAATRPRWKQPGPPPVGRSPLPRAW